MGGRGKSMSASVFGNRDLVRHLLSLDGGNVGLLSASKAIRDGEECRARYEEWAVEGCPSEASGEDATCLQGLGGRDSGFCRGVYEVVTMREDGWPTTSTVPAESLLDRVLRLLPRHRSHLQTVIFVGMGHVTARFQLGEENTLTTSHSGWRKRGGPCRLTMGQVRVVLRGLLVGTGSVALPCPTTSRAVGPIRVPRRVHIRMVRWDELRQHEWLVMHGQRT